MLCLCYQAKIDGDLWLFCTIGTFCLQMTVFCTVSTAALLIYYTIAPSSGQVHPASQQALDIFVDTEG